MYIWGDHFTDTDNDFDTKYLIRGYLNMLLQIL